jgi:hypothetical protein
VFGLRPSDVTAFGDRPPCLVDEVPAEATVANKPRIFLSHSSKDATLTDQVAAALATPTPTHPGYEVLVDKTCLAAGEEWPIQLHVMMAYAHAGLILFTPAALQRPHWILKEAYILTWRRSLDPTFPVFYALLDGVTPDQIDAVGFEPAHLRLIQGLSSTKAEDIAEDVRKDGPQAPGPATPLEQLTTKLAHALNSIGTNLGTISGNLGIPQLPFQLDPTKKEAAQIAARLIQGSFGSYSNVGNVIDDLRGYSVPKEALTNVLKWMAPHWLTPEISGRFAAVVHELWDEKKGGWAAVSGKHLVDYTGQMLVDRVRPFMFGTKVAQIELGSDRNDADYYTEQICSWYRGQYRTSEYPRTNTDIIQRLRDQRPWLFVPIAPVDAETINALRRRFPHVVFLILTNPVGTSEGDVIALTPDIDTRREHDELQQYRYAMDVVKQA